MRTKLMLTLITAALASLGATSYFLLVAPLPSQEETVIPALHSTARTKENSPPIREERHIQPAPQEQRQLARMNDKIASLEAKLRNLEALASKHAQDHTTSESDESEADKDSNKTKPKRLSENDFGPVSYTHLTLPTILRV